MVQSVASLNLNSLPPSLRAIHLLPEVDRKRLQQMIQARQAQLAAAKSIDQFSKYQDDPHGYARDVLKVTLTEEQADILTSVKDNRYTLAKASHSVGKTFLAAVAACWWYDCWPEHIVYITAPTWSQALGLTFKEVKTMRRTHVLPGKILPGSGIVRDEDLILEASHYIRALNADSGEGFQGEHTAPILIIVEEGVDVPKYIWEAIKGLMTNADCRVLVIGNPTNKATDFGLAAESPLYNVLSINGLEHVNVKARLQCQPMPFPKAIDLIYVAEMLEENCTVVETLTEDAFEWHTLEQVKGAIAGTPVNGDTCYYMPDAIFQGRVLGIFPTQADKQVIPEGWLKTLPVLELQARYFPEIGCDVARYGDDRTTIFVRRGPVLLKGRELRNKDNVQVAAALKDEALEAIQQYKGEAWTSATKRDDQIAWAKLVLIKIDVTGASGTGPHDILRADGYNAYAVNSSNTAMDSEQFKNVRSELWWCMRTRAQKKTLDLSRIEPKLRQRLERELSTPTYEAPGVKIVETKKSIKKRLGVSPDLADGANLAMYNVPNPKDEIISSGRW